MVAPFFKDLLIRLSQLSLFPIIDAELNFLNHLFKHLTVTIISQHVLKRSLKEQIMPFSLCIYPCRFSSSMHSAKACIPGGFILYRYCKSHDIKILGSVFTDTSREKVRFLSPERHLLGHHKCLSSSRTEDDSFKHNYLHFCFHSK